MASTSRVVQARCVTERTVSQRAAVRLVLLLLVPAVTPSLGFDAYADEGEPAETYPDRFLLAIGYMYMSDIVTDVSLNNPQTGGIGTRIDYSRDLGGDSSDDLVRVRGYYRFNPRHRLEFSAGSIGRTGDRVLALEVSFGDEDFGTSERILSSIDTTIYKLGYAYSFYHSSRVELSVAGGLNIMDYSIELTSTLDGDDAAGDVTAPMPVWGMRAEYSITPRWRTNFGFQTFYINLDDKYRGSVLDTELEIEYRLFRNVGVGIGLSHLGMDLKAETDSFRGRITEIYRGAEVFVSARF